MAGVVGGGTPTDVVNQALDAILWPTPIGDLQDGTEQAQVALRHYGPCRQQLLRAAHWNFARSEAPMLLLADRTGQTPDVGTLVPGGWTYEYAYPQDAVKARFVPWNREQPFIPAGNDQIPTTVPLTSGLQNQPAAFPGQARVARFLETVDTNYPVDLGQVNWDTPNVSPQGRRVILTNVQDAKLVYTRDILYPALWDALFRSALVAYLAAELAGPIWSKAGKEKFGLQLRDDQSAIVKAKVVEARMADGNEGIHTSDIRVDWMDNRRAGGWGNNWFGAGGGPGLGYGDGVTGYGWDSLALPGGAVF